MRKKNTKNNNSQISQIVAVEIGGNNNNNNNNNSFLWIESSVVNDLAMTHTRYKDTSPIDRDEMPPYIRLIG